MEKIRKMAEDLFALNPLDTNVYDITLKEKMYEDGYFSLKFEGEKVLFEGAFQITLLEENDKIFRKGLEQFIQDPEKINALAKKYIHAYNKACSMHINPYLQENNCTVEGDGEPEWIILYQKDLTKEFVQCEKNRDMIMVISEEVARVGFNLVFQDMREKYFATRNQMLKEAKEVYVLEKKKLFKNEPGKTQPPSVSADSKSIAKPLQIKIFSHLDKQELEKEVNHWLKENNTAEIQGLEFNTCSWESQVESNIFLVYK